MDFGFRAIGRREFASLVPSPGGGYGSIAETNDGSTTVGETLPAALGGAAPAESGLGPIAMDSATGAFFLDPESQANRVELAYVVIPDDSTAPVDLFLEVLGSGDVNAAFVFNGNEPVRIFVGVPEPSAASLAWLATLALPFLRRNSVRHLKYQPSSASSRFS